ncbi:putative multidrug export ATP-binding/permease protein YgaD [Tritrichomonas foetus]|uniref:Multidrug export ATP-binding/permease protein YgaD n=1 Tax=Tritrichomonas foetus TaxID=1144522 RepID=A0A1J4KVB7_9EUKA|nr:putative multidrug export ATP-binding/permease protein YgaD [Tritrichomonas foetus]|eukprot:OHT13453.1 putative multidrug export ATP-binding/permease protein YgaD [Tritrichomonas foetus]
MIQTINKFFHFAGERKNDLIKGLTFDFVKSMIQGLNIFVVTYIIQAISDGTICYQNAINSFLILLLIMVISIVLDYQSSILKYCSSYLMVADHMVQIGERMKYIPLGYFDQNSLGEITHTLTSSITDIEDIAPNIVISVIQGFLQIISYIIILILFDYHVSLIIICALSLFIVNQNQLHKKTRKVAPIREKAIESLNSASLEFIQGMQVVREYNYGQQSSQRIHKTIKECEKMNLALEFAVIPSSFIQSLILKGFSIIIVAYAFYFVNDLVKCITLMMISFNIFDKLNRAGQLSALIETIDGAFDRVERLNKTPLMDIDGNEVSLSTNNQSYISDGMNYSKSDNKDYQIIGENISFSYNEKRKNVIDNVSFKIKKNTLTAIVGSSGSGKTTLCNLIARFWDINSGRILINNYDISNIKLDCLMSNISIVFQNVYLFNDSIRNNIKFGKPSATHDEIVDAAKRAYCDDFISEFPDGYETVIGEGGSTLSGGEKQRISIARALLKNASIIILDEATANVDPENEDRLQQAIEELTKNKTVIVIAHRLKTIKNADQIIVMNHGRIEERGNHDELVKNAESQYAKLVNARKEAIGWRIA